MEVVRSVELTTVAAVALMRPSTVSSSEVGPEGGWRSQSARAGGRGARRPHTPTDEDVDTALEWPHRAERLIGVCIRAVEC